MGDIGHGPNRHKNTPGHDSRNHALPPGQDLRANQSQVGHGHPEHLAGQDAPVSHVGASHHADKARNAFQMQANNLRSEHHAQIGIDHPSYKALPPVELTQNTASIKLDGHKSVNQLIQDGKLQNAQTEKKPEEKKEHTPDVAHAGEQRHHAGSLPKIKVQLEDSDPTHHLKPNFIVEKNQHGKIHIKVVDDPEKHPGKEIVVQLARRPDQLNPSAEEQKAVSELASYLYARIKTKHPEVADTGVDLEDKQGLVMDSVKAAIAKHKHAEVRLPDATQHQVDRMNRFNGGHGVLTHHQIQDYVPERIAAKPSETIPQLSMKDAVAGMFNPDRSQPYETIRTRTNGGFAVGRYGLTNELISIWITDLFGNPPQWDKIAELIAEGKLPKNFANPNFLNGFLSLVEKLKGMHGNVSSAEIDKYLPKELQETISGNLIQKFAKFAEGDIGKVALSMLLGRQAQESDLANEGYRGLVDAARKMYGLSMLNQVTEPNNAIEWSGIAPRSKELIAAARETANVMHRTGKCAYGVEWTLEKLGIVVHGHAYELADKLAHDSRFVEVSTQKLAPGAIVVRGRSAGHPYGHVFVYLGNSEEASDHIQNLTNASVYGPSRAFVLRA